MNLKQKSFLDDFAALLQRYNIDNMQVSDQLICFYSNYHALRVERFNMINGSKPKFFGVVSDYLPEDERCNKLFEESELDDERKDS